MSKKRGRTLTLSVMEDELGKTKGRNDKLRGHIGVSTIALSEGWTIGPPAEREYAVEPVGVDTINPSDCDTMRQSRSSWVRRCCRR